jgi:uncharacterized protein YndB with AHSA1/START domain
MTNTTKVEPSVITREYNAPIQLVYECWTQIDHLIQWNIPFEGFKCEYTRTDLRTGGNTLHKMTAPNGFEMWLLSEYISLTPPTEVVFNQSMATEQGEIISNPQNPNWPRTMRTTIQLAEANGKTQLTLLWEPENPTAAEIEAFEASRADHHKGWGAGLEMLGKYLQSK